MKTCPRCDGKKFWSLSTGQKRCNQCGLTRKYDKTLWHSTKISPYWKGRLLEFFCLGVPAYRLRFQVPLDSKAVQRWFRILRGAIYGQVMQELSELSGEIEMDESMFGGRVPDKRGWGAAGKRMVFGLYQMNGKVLAFPITSRGTRELIPLMSGHAKAGSLYYTDDWHAYPRFISIPISTATINASSLTTFTFPVFAFLMTLSLLAVCSPGRNNFAAEGYMDLDIPSILNYNIASCTVVFYLR